MKRSVSSAPTNHTQQNIDAISKLEHDALLRRSPLERVSDRMAGLIGSPPFLALQFVIFGSWAALNFRPFRGMRPFDPFPLGILALVMSSESVFLTIFVLISQNRMSRQSERRSHLDLQVSMLAEQELTTILKIQQKICQHLGIDIEAAKRDIEGFSAATDVHKLASELDEKLPDHISE